MERSMPRTGEPAPWFTCRSPVNPRFHFDTLAGRFIVLCFFGTSTNDIARRTLASLRSRCQHLDGIDCSLFGVSIDPQDELNGNAQETLPGIHFFWDFDQRVSTLYGTIKGETFMPTTFVLDERLRIAAIVPLMPVAEQHAEAVIAALNSLPRLNPPSLADVPAPVLIVPRIFEPGLCQALIQHYNELGGGDSGFMREVDGKTVGVYDYAHKRRCDLEIADDQLKTACMHRIHDRLAPEIQKAFQFRATRIERHLIACYEGSSGGHFRAHRDNTTKGTAHRRFAVTLNLNTGEYEGGQLWFPEFGQQRYVAPLGSAVVFSCSLLHEATPVTSGSRYAFLPFLYDDAAAIIREQNRKYIESNPT